jgi:uncharacterized protein (DUF934 family)
MVGIVRDGELIEDPYQDATALEDVPASGPVIVNFEQWQQHRESLLARGDAVGVQLRSDQSPDLIADDLPSLSLVALEFPAFRDGRAYSYARLLRDRHGFKGEVRAVGDVLLEQLHFMLRTGFNAFRIKGKDPLGQFHTALEDYTVWYQPTGDGRPAAWQLRHRMSRPD